MLTSIEKHLIAWVCGAISAALFGAPGLLVVLPILLFTRRFCLGIFAGLGFIWVSIFLHIQVANLLPENLSAMDGRYQGRISDVKAGKDMAQFRFEISQGNWRGWALAVSCYRCTLDLQDGQEWELTLNVRPFRNLHNPGGRDYRAQQSQRKLIAAAYVRNPTSGILLHGDNPGMRDTLRETIYTVIFKADAKLNTQSMLLALLTGDKSRLPKEVYQTLVSAGLIHLFVVSGLHISLVFAFIFYASQILLRFTWLLHLPGQALSVLCAACAALFYGYITGLEVPALRAVFSVCCVVWLAWQMGSISLFRLWLLACVFVLICQPVAFAGLGAQLSFGVVLAFAWVLSGRKVSGLQGFVLLQFAAFGAGAVLLAWVNLPVPLAGLLLNAFFIPLISLCVLPLAVLYVVLALCGLELQALIWLLDKLLTIPMNWLLEQNWPVLQISHLQLWPFMILLLLLLLPRFLGVRRMALTGLLLLLCLPPGLMHGWKLHVFDVGQGSAQLLQVAGRNILIDTGDRFLSGTRVADFTLLPALRYLGVERLDMLLVTHHDADHSGGLDAVLQAGLLQGPLLDEDSCALVRWHIAELDFRIFQLEGSSGNNHSCVLSIESPYGSALLPGDIERRAERLLLAELGHRDVLLVPHHGSKTSSSAVFLDKISPDLAIISAGVANRYGHPHQVVLQRLSESGAQVLSTASHGAVSLSFSPRQAGPSVSTYRPDFYPLVEE